MGREGEQSPTVPGLYRQVYWKHWLQFVLEPWNQIQLWCVFQRDIQTPRRKFKIIRRAAEYFWRNSSYLDSRWNTVSIYNWIIKYKGLQLRFWIIFRAYFFCRILAIFFVKTESFTVFRFRFRFAIVPLFRREVTRVFSTWSAVVPAHFHNNTKIKVRSRQFNLFFNCFLLRDQN